MSRNPLAIFPIDRADADRAAAVIAATPLLAAAQWAATLIAGLALIAAAALTVNL